MKKLLAICLAVCLLISLSACGAAILPGSTTTAGQPNTTTNKQPDPPGSTGGNTHPDIGEGYVDHWFLYGDLYLESIAFAENGDWELMATESEGAEVFCQGSSVMDEDTSLHLFDSQGDAVGSAYIENEALILTMTEDYEWLFAGYHANPVSFKRSTDSAYSSGEDLSSAYQGYWLYDNGNVLQIYEETWYAYDNTGALIYSGPLQIDAEEAWMLNADGSSGGGVLRFDENGNLTESGQVLTYSEYFPYGSSENTADNAILLGEWQYSNQAFTLTFDGVDSFTWTTDSGTETGAYHFDGENLVLWPESGGTIFATLNAEGQLTLDGSGDGYYARAEMG